MLKNFFKISNLFSIFDPSTSKYFSLNWLSLFLPLMFYYYLLYKFNFNRISILFLSLEEYIITSLQNNMKNYLHACLIIFYCLFVLIMNNNFLGLFPYIFTPTSHLVIAASLCLPLWLTFIMKTICMNLFSFMSHLIPSGTPFILAPFMVFIETTSIMIRPLTLTVRLVANMVAGHLLITLLSNLMNKMIFLFILSLLPIFCLYILEMSVALIQAYVFMTLLSLYLNETNY